MENKGTKFATIYDRFLGKITDDMYVELTPQDTLKDLHSLLIQALPGFEFPRKNLFDYVENIKIIDERDLTEDDFVLGVVWNELPEDIETPQKVIIDNSCFNMLLTSEEVNIIAILMMCGWVQRQVTSIENTRMKYSGPDFKMTSQANHLQKLLSLLSECHRQSIHMQRLYKRRRTVMYIDQNDNITERYRSNWDIFNTGVLR